MAIKHIILLYKETYYTINILHYCIILLYILYYCVNLRGVSTNNSIIRLKLFTRLTLTSNKFDHNVSVRR